MSINEHQQDLQHAQNEAEDLAVQLELLADNAKNLSHAATTEAVYYGLNWIQSILRHDVLHTLNTVIGEIAFTLDCEAQEKLQGSLGTTADSIRKEKAQ